MTWLLGPVQARRLSFVVLGLAMLGLLVRRRLGRVFGVTAAAGLAWDWWLDVEAKGGLRQWREQWQMSP